MVVDGANRAVAPFDAPPDLDVGRIQNVEFDYSRDYSSSNVEHSCCNCGEPILVTDEHVRATGWVEATHGHRHRMGKFCDAEYWTSWAGAGRVASLDEERVRKSQPQWWWCQQFCG